MEPELKRKWVEALRSGKYKQCRKMIRTSTTRGTEHCCLGVLLDIVEPEGWTAPWNHRLAQVDAAFIARPAELGLRGQGKLAKMNDSGRAFSEIADYIEKTL